MQMGGLLFVAVSGREGTVAVLVSLGADAGALADPSPGHPLGKTTADLAYGNGQRGISGFLAATPMSYGDVLETLSMKDSLTAVFTQAADRLHQVFRMQSFQRKQLSELGGDNEFDISDELAVSFAAAKTKKPGHINGAVHAAAVQIQKIYCGWKKRKEFF